MTRCLVRSVLALGIAALACACSDPTARVRREMQQIRRLSVPPDVIEHGETPIRREGHGRVLAWEFETAMACADYVGWLRGRLPDGFEPRAEEAGLVRFSRQLPADIQVLEVQRERLADQERLVLRLESHAF